MKRKVAFLLVLVTVACSLAFSQAKKEVKIGLAVPNLQADFFNQIKDSVTAEAAKQNISLLVADAKNDAATQVSQVMDFITNGITVLIYIPAGATAASVPVALAKDAKIPVICVDRFPPDLPGDTFIASDSVASTKILGEWVIKQTGGVGNVAIIHGQMGTTPEVDRSKGWGLAMAKAPKMKIVAEQTANWDADQALTVAQDMLQKNPAISVFFGQCDTMAISAARAAKAANLKQKVISVGFDGDAAALVQLKNGEFDATMTQRAQEMGRLAFQSALDILNGKKLPKQTLFPAALTTKENVDQFIAKHP
jgi:ribose transport system substrate-binding protein